MPADAGAADAAGTAAARWAERVPLEPRRREQARRRPRYTRFVTLMKIFLPTLAAALLLAVFMWPGHSARTDGFRLSFSELGAAGGTIEMLNPRYVGLDATGRNYYVTAERAQPAAADRRLVELTAPQADLTEPDGRWFSVGAKRGSFRQQTSELTLEDGFSVFTDLGYELSGERAHVDLAAGRAQSDRPVEMQGPLGTLRADRMRVEDKGARLLFEGAVHLNVYPGAKG